MSLLVSSFGTSTPYAYWGFVFIEKILTEAHGAFHRIHCHTRDELRTAWQARAGRATLVTTDYPDFDLAALLLEFEFPITAFVDLPEDAIDVAMRTRDMAPDQACRFNSQVFSRLEPALCSPRTKIFGPEWYDRPLSEFARDLARAILRDMDEDRIERIVTACVQASAPDASPTVWEALSENAPAALPRLRGFQELRPAHQRLVRAWADAYGPILHGNAPASFVWSKELFFFTGDGAISPDDIDLLGSARFLMWGPYLFLPLGLWRAEVEFEIAENLSGNEIEADIVIGGAVAAVKRGSLPVLGVYQFAIDFEVTETVSPIEVRVQILKGAIEGRFGLRKVTMARREREPQTALPPDETRRDQRRIGA